MNFQAQLKTVPRWTKIGVIGAVLMYIALASIASTAIPWWIGKGDSALHVDYALSVYHRHIPKYHDFVQYPIFHEIDPGYKTQDQRAAANPPLFYILHAPVVGPFLDAGEWRKAIGLGRSLNILIAAIAVLTLAWAGWLFGGKRKEIFAVSVAAISGLSYSFVSLNENYALDALVVLLGVLTIINWQKLIYGGLQTRYLVSLLALSILGMSTKATYIVFLGLSLLTVMIATQLHGKSTKLKKLLQGSIICSFIIAGVLIAIGWFYYYWNYKISGKWYTAELPEDFSSRPYKSLHMVLTSRGLWSNFYQRISSSAIISEIITFSSLTGAIIGLQQIKLKKILKDKSMIIVFTLLSLVLIGTTFTQITHAVGIGNISFRYFLPALLVFGLFISYGLLQIKQARGQLVSLALMGMALTSINTIARMKNIKAIVPAVGTTNNVVEKLNIAMTNNGFPRNLPLLLFILLVVGFGLTAYSLFELSKPSKRTLT